METEITWKLFEMVQQKSFDDLNAFVLAHNELPHTELVI